MSDQRFDVIVHEVAESVNTHMLAEKLSRLLKQNIQQIEMQLVKAKRSNGIGEALISGLTKEKAEEFQELLHEVGLKTTLDASLSLVPIRKEKKIDKFTCLACNLTQVHDGKNKYHMCSECGVIQEKYEEVQSIKKYEESVLKHNKLLEEQENAYVRKSAQEKLYVKQSKKEGGQVKSKKQKKKQILVLSMVLGFFVMGGGMYYLYDQHLKKLEERAQIANQKNSRKGGDATVANSAITNKEAGKNPDVVVQTQGNEFEELGNPYSKFSNPSMKKVTFSDGIHKINSLLVNTKLKLPKGDKTTLQKISNIYKEAESKNNKKIDYSYVRQLTSAIKNTVARDIVKQQVSWSEIKSGLITFEELGIYPTVRKGWDDPEVSLVAKLINLYIDNNQFTQAIKASDEIKNKYFKSVVLYKIIEGLLKNSLIDDSISLALELNSQIKAMVEQSDTEETIKPLILGIYAKGEMLLASKKSEDSFFKQILALVDEVKKPEEKVQVLVQLSEDQREAKHFKLSSLFLDEASNIFNKSRNKLSGKDELSALMVKQYAKLLDFNRAKLILVKIKDRKKMNITKTAIMMLENKVQAKRARKDSRV